MPKKKELAIEQYFNGSIKVAMFTMLPLLAFMAWVIGMPLLLYGGLMTSIDNAQNAFQTLFIFSFPMLLFFAAVPVLIEWKKKVALKELGLIFECNKKNVILLSINSTIVIFMFSKIAMLGNSVQEVIPVILQLCAIGISEEILCRSVISYEIKKIAKKDIFVVLISSFIFAFLFHSGDNDLSNLIIRVPLGLILGSVRYYTGNVYNSIAMHVWYNAFMFIL